MNNKNIYLDRLAEIYDEVDAVGTKVAELYQARPSECIRILLQMLSRMAQLIRLKTRRIELTDSAEEVARLVKETVSAWSKIQNLLNSERAEKENHGW